MEQAIADISSVGEEILNLEGLEGLLTSGKEVVAYDGFEPSGWSISLPQGVLRAHNTNKMTRHGVKFKFWVADWFAMMNHKMGGDLKKIRKAGALMIETWKACGMDMNQVEFIWASDEINSRADEYWSRVMDVATKMNLNRVLRCTQIMGRKGAFETEEVEQLRAENFRLRTELALARGEEVPVEEDTDKADGTGKKEGGLTASQIFYPCMQCADIFFLGVDICSLGMDQRKVNAMAIEYCDKIKRKYKPVVVSHHMLMGLDGSDKMSKSNPDNAIFMHDTEADVKRKIKKAYCKPGEIEGNPMIEYCQYVVFPVLGILEIARKDEHGGNLVYKEFEQVVEDFLSEKLHPMDLKVGVTAAINTLLTPVRLHFENDPEAKKLLAEVKKFKK